MSKTDKILTSEYLDWHAKLSGLPSVLTDKIRSSLYKKYKKETGHEPWQLSEVHESEVINSKPKNKVSSRRRAYYLRCQTRSRINYQIRLRAFHMKF